MLNHPYKSSTPVVLTIPELFPAVATSARRPVLVHVALEAGIGTKGTPTDWAFKWAIS